VGFTIDNLIHSELSRKGDEPLKAAVEGQFGSSKTRDRASRVEKYWRRRKPDLVSLGRITG
jgi:hypothetical protein